MKKVFIGLIVLIFLVGCAKEETVESEQPLQQISTPKEESPITTIPKQPEQPPTIEESKPIIKISSDIKEILEKGKTKLKSYSYYYKKPESELEYQFYVKGNNIKLILPEMDVQEQGKFYNTLYFNTENKTAEAYCIGYSSCEGKVGKVKDLSYKDTYIETPLDWLEKVTEAEKIDQRQVEGRNALYIQTNIGKIIVESSYGFLYRIEDGKKVWQFTDAAFNSVKDSDVTPT